MTCCQWTRLFGSLVLLLALRVFQSLAHVFYSAAQRMYVSPVLDWAWGHSAQLRRYFSFRLGMGPSLAVLDARGLIEEAGFNCEEHTVTTEDGYILGLQRIVPRPVEGAEGSTSTSPRRPPALLVHGLMQCSESFLTGGGGSALAFALAAAGYDVWLGNVRGTRYSRKHLSLTPGAKPPAHGD